MHLSQGDSDRGDRRARLTPIVVAIESTSVDINSVQSKDTFVCTLLTKSGESAYSANAVAFRPHE